MTLPTEAKELCQYRHVVSYNDSYFGEPAGLVKRAIAALERMPNDEALLRQALQALDPCDGVRWGGMGKVRAAAIAALRERLK